MNIQASGVTQSFIDALKQLEDDQDTGAIAELFSDDATLERLTHKTYKGKADALAFWREYLEPFEKISTTFFNVTEGNDSAVLEWESKGTLKGGKEISYRGASSFDVLDGKVTSFRTYYDSAMFVPESSKS